MIVTTHFQKNVLFLGRNGTFKATGLEIREFNRIINLSPITSQHKLASCFVQIPIEDIPTIIKALTRFLEEPK